MLANSKITVGGASIWSNYNYDALGRIGSAETLNDAQTAGIKHNLSYVDVGTNGTTGLVSSVEFMKKDSGNWTSINKKSSYEYDDVGNITDITDINSNLIVHYEYDNLNQLIRENNVNLNKTIAYSYDLGGNIQSKKIYAYTTGDLSTLTPDSTVVYGYSDSNWKDKMTSYGDDQIIYDAIGNPLEYRGGMQFEWSHGRRLDKASNSSYNVSYKYDDGGIRTSKTVNGTTTDFITSGIQVLAQKTGDNVLAWQVDGNGSTVGFNYKGTQYLYLKNAQGDIAGITDSSGNIVAEYLYDSWGKMLHVLDATGTEITDSSNIALINPLRYRGYYYDSELGLYYLNARYYDPETGRFINADDNFSSLNIFSYCYNNSINFADPAGVWGTDVHSGMNSTDYGTYHWAIKCGISDSDAKIIALANDNVDTKYWPGWYWGQHFKAHGSEKWIDERYNAAVASYNKGTDKDKLNGLKALGEALHAEQDLDAHLDWNVLPWGDWGIHTSYDYITGEKSQDFFDHVNYKVWRDTDDKFKHIDMKKKEDNPRFTATLEKTNKMIERFIKDTGYKVVVT